MQKQSVVNISLKPSYGQQFSHIFYQRSNATIFANHVTRECLTTHTI